MIHSDNSLNPMMYFPELMQLEIDRADWSSISSTGMTVASFDPRTRTLFEYPRTVLVDLVEFLVAHHCFDASYHQSLRLEICFMPKKTAF